MKYKLLVLMVMLGGGLFLNNLIISAESIGDPQVTFTQANVVVSGNVVTNPTFSTSSNNFSFGVSTRELDSTTGNLIKDWGNVPLVNANSTGMAASSFVTASSDFRTTSTVTRTVLTVSSGTVDANSGRILGPYDQFDGQTVLDTIVISCDSTAASGSPTVDTFSASVVGGTATALIPEGGEGCRVSYNFVPANDVSSSDPPGIFSGFINVIPSTAVVRPGQVKDYNVTFRSYSSGGQTVYFNLAAAGQCPTSSSCTFVGGNSVNVPAGGVGNKTLRITTSPATPLANYPFRVVAAPTNSASDPVRISDNASLSVASSTAPGDGNHAQFISYANVPSTMNPGETRTVSVTMKNDGTKPWYQNTGGASCASSSPRNGYSLHSWNPQDNGIWGITSVPVTGIAPPIFSPAVRSIGLWGQSQAGTYDISDIFVYDQDGNMVAPSEIYYWDGSPSYPSDPGNPVRDNYGWQTAEAQARAINLTDGDPDTYITLNGFPGPNANTELNVMFPTGSLVNVSRIDIYTRDGGAPRLRDGDLRIVGRLSSSPADRATDGTLWKWFGQGAGNDFPVNQWLYAIPGNVGEQVTFTFQITAPTLPGTYPFQWRMAEDCVEDFDNSATLQNITVPDTAARVDLKVNSADHAIVNVNEPLTLTWTTGNTPSSCTAFGTWSGAKSATGGSEDRSADITTAGVKTYTITCTNSAGSNTDTATVVVNNIPLVCNPNIIGTNQMVSCVFQWSGSAGAFTPDLTNSNFVIHSQGPTRPAAAASSPVPMNLTVIDDNYGNMNSLNNRYIVSWKGRFNFNPGSYVFTVDSDDGSRLYMDGNLLIDYWSDHGRGNPRSVTQTFSAAGVHELIYNMYQNTGGAGAYLAWDRPPALSYTPSSFFFTGIKGSANPPAQTLTITNSGGGSLSWTVAVSAPWLDVSRQIVAGEEEGARIASASQAASTSRGRVLGARRYLAAQQESGTQAGGTSSLLNVAANTSSLNVGSYNGALNITSGAGSATIPVTFAVNPGACPSTNNSVSLSSSTINVTGTATASGPAGFSGGSFASSNTNVATVLGSTITGVEGSTGGGTSSITGSGWSYAPTGATGCALAGAALTVRDFSLSTIVGSQSVARGTNAVFQVRANSVNSFSSSVSLSQSGAPAVPTFSPSSGNPTYTSTITLPTSSVSPGTYPFTVTGTYNGHTHSANLTLTVLAPPNAPSDISLNNSAQCGRITITWTDNATNETGFHIWRDTSPGGNPPTQSYGGITYYQIATVGANVTTYTDAPAAGSSYRYGVSAYGSGGDSALSGTSTAGPTYNNACTPNLALSNKIIDKVNGQPYTGQTIKNNDVLTFKIIIDNSAGTAPAYDVYIEDTLSSNLAYEPGTARIDRGSGFVAITGERIQGQTITWDFPGRNLGDKPANATNWLITFDAKVNSSSSQATDFFQNTAKVYYSLNDGGSQNQTVTTRTALTPLSTGRSRVPEIKEIAP